jgi:formylglycine-generating enzyme required for sulfatase activity/pimeloyl-ACP methyl ester carboxylesterase
MITAKDPHIRLKSIPAGEFLMGSDDSDPDAAPDESVIRDGKRQKHLIRISAFYLGVTEVTRGQFHLFVGETGYKTEAESDGKGGWGWNEQTKEFEQDPKYTWRNPGFDQTDDHPAVNVSWNDSVAFCNWLNQAEGWTYRLPTEAEWEYACRARTTTRYFSGDDPETLASVGNVADGTLAAKLPNWAQGIAAQDGYVFTAPVGRFRPNAFGLYDMHGNVWEWCQDVYDAEYYRRSSVEDPTGSSDLSQAAERVLRGGSWDNAPDRCRSAARLKSEPKSWGCSFGFRVARETVTEQTTPGDNRDREGRPFVITMHGIKTRGTWQKDLASELSDAGFPNRAIDYDNFRALQLIYPPSRRKKIEWFREMYAQICRERGIERPSVVAHSFGTYLVARAIQIYGLKFDRVIFCGSIVRRDFPWTEVFKKGHVRAVLNDFGGLDVWAWVVKYFVSDADQSGRYGFKDTAGGDMVQVYRPEFRHGDFFTQLNYDRNWIPFLRGELPKDEAISTLSGTWWPLLTIPAVLLTLALLLWLTIAFLWPRL